MSISRFDATAAAALLLTARRDTATTARLDPQPCDTHAAYRVQRAVLQGLGDSGGVWKLALLGGVQREAGLLPLASLHRDGASLQLPAHAAIEVETALVLGGDPGPAPTPAAIAGIRLAFEVVASRLGPDAPPLARMADAFSSVAVVLGAQIGCAPEALPDRLGITLRLEDRDIDAPETAAPIPEALDFLGWLSGHARRQGLPLKRGDVVITGARIGPVPLGATRRVAAVAMGASVRARLRASR